MEEQTSEPVPTDFPILVTNPSSLLAALRIPLVTIVTVVWYQVQVISIHHLQLSFPSELGLRLSKGNYL